MIRSRRHKTAILTWIAVYPIITVLAAVLDPVLGGWGLPLRTLVLSGLMVPTMVYAVMPLLARMFAGWLADDVGGTSRR